MIAFFAHKKRMFDTVAERKDRNVIGQDMTTLSEARAAWDSLRSFRENAARNLRFTYGDQWVDKIRVNDAYVTERAYIESKGKSPQQFNRIAAFVHAIIGQYVQSPTESVCSARARENQSLSDDLTTTIKYAYQRNSLSDVDKNTLRMFAITGIACHRTTFGWDDTEDISEVNVSDVNYNRVFFDRFGEDVRHTDLSLIGEIHDMSLNDVVSIFGYTPERMKRVREIYGYIHSDGGQTSLRNLDGDKLRNIDFLSSDEPNRARVIEVWKREAKTRYRCYDKLKGEEFHVEVSDIGAVDAVNEERKKQAVDAGASPDSAKLIEYGAPSVDRFWYYRYLSPLGHVLAEGETPYEHRSHPYSLKVFPFANGEVHSAVSLVIDPQKYLNRIMTMQDFVQDSAAKGTLLVPDHSISDIMPLNEMREQWSDPNGVVVYKYNVTGGKPEQVIHHATSSGALEMFNATNKLFDDIGGVSSALQGQSTKSGTPASLYAQQAQNSAILLTDLITAYQSFRESRDKKILRLQLQFYDEPRYLNIVGDASSRSFLFDPEKYKGIQFDLVISSSNATPIARATQNEFLLRLLEMGQVDAKTILEVGAFPFGDKLLQIIKSNEEEMVQRQMKAQQELQQLERQTGEQI